MFYLDRKILYSVEYPLLLPSVLSINNYSTHLSAVFITD